MLLQPIVRRFETMLAFAFVAAGFVLLDSARADSETIPTRPGVTVPFEIDVPSGAPAIVLIFEGGGGSIERRAFGWEIHELLVDDGIGAASIGAPSDQHGFLGGMHPSFRATDQHVDDIDIVLGAIVSEYDLPIWVFGVSMGAASAAMYGLRRSGRVAGVVLASSPTRPPRGLGVHELPLDQITVPLLAVAHADDGCPGTPPTGAQEIVNAASSSPNARARIFSGGDSAGWSPCRPRSHHTFYRIEREVGRAVADFIKSNTP